MDKKENMQESAQGGITLKEAFGLLKKNLILIIAIIIAFTVIGVAVAFTKTPSYTVTHKLVFTGAEAGQTSPREFFNTTNAYANTLIDLFDEETVAEGANYYYKQYLNQKLDDNSGVKSVEDYIKNFNVNTDYYIKKDTEDEYFKQKLEEYFGEKEADENNYIRKSSIGVSKLEIAESEFVFVFKVSYTDQNVADAKDKLKILIHSFDVESSPTRPHPNGALFGQISFNIYDLGQEGEVANLSITKTVLIFCIIGVIISILAVVLKELFDFTIKSREEVERLTGVPLISAIRNKE